MTKSDNGQEKPSITFEKLKEVFRRLTKTNPVKPQAPSLNTVNTKTPVEKTVKPAPESEQVTTKAQPQASPDPLKPAMNLAIPGVTTELRNKIVASADRVTVTANRAKMDADLVRADAAVQAKEAAVRDRTKVSANRLQIDVDLAKADAAAHQRRDTRAQSMDNDGYSDMPISFSASKPKQEAKEIKGRDDVVYVNMNEQAKIDADASIVNAKQRLEAFNAAKATETKKQTSQNMPKDTQSSKESNWQAVPGKYNQNTKSSVVEPQPKSNGLEKLKNTLTAVIKVTQKLNDSDPKNKDYLSQVRKDEYKNNFDEKQKARSSTGLAPQKVRDNIKTRSQTLNEHASKHPAETPAEANKHGKGKTGLNI